jgi:hypothetical protein
MGIREAVVATAWCAPDVTQVDDQILIAILNLPAP